MTIQINEVWNAEGRSEKLVAIETYYGQAPNIAVMLWIATNRPELTLANGLSSHGFHAVELKEETNGTST